MPWGGESHDCEHRRFSAGLLQCLELSSEKRQYHNLIHESEANEYPPSAPSVHFSTAAAPSKRML